MHYPNAKSVIWGHDLDGKKLKNGKVFASMEMDGKIGFADGIRCDEDGKSGPAWLGSVTVTTAVHVFAPTATASARSACRKSFNIALAQQARNRFS